MGNREKEGEKWEEKNDRPPDAHRFVYMGLTRREPKVRAEDTGVYDGHVYDG